MTSWTDWVDDIVCDWVIEFQTYWILVSQLDSEYHFIVSRGSVTSCQWEMADMKRPARNRLCKSWWTLKTTMLADWLNNWLFTDKWSRWQTDRLTDRLTDLCFVSWVPVYLCCLALCQLKFEVSVAPRMHATTFNDFWYDFSTLCLCYQLLHCTAFPCTTSRYLTLHYLTLHCTTLD